MRIVKIISFLAAFFLPISANATPDEMACDIIEAAINYRFEQDGGRGVCGTDSVTNKRLCLRKPSDRFFVSTDTFKLEKPLESSSPEFVPAIKLPDSVKKQVESKSREVSMSRIILVGRKKVEQAKSENKSYSKFLVGMAESDLTGDYYERQIKLWTKKNGPSDPKVIDLEQKYASHLERREEALSKTTSELEAEVSYVDQINFDLLLKQLNKDSGLEAEVWEAKRNWDSLNWLGSIDCTNKVRPRNAMLVKRDEEYIVVQTDKVFKPYYNWHPKSFSARSVAIDTSGEYAFIKVSGHGGGSSYSLGTTPPTYLLKKASDGWVVLASSGIDPVFY